MPITALSAMSKMGLSCFFFHSRVPIMAYPPPNVNKPIFINVSISSNKIFFLMPFSRTAMAVPFPGAVAPLFLRRIAAALAVPANRSTNLRLFLSERFQRFC